MTAWSSGEIQQAPAYRSATEKAHVQKEPEKKPFSLPWVRRCATSAVSYLQRRGISSDVIGRCFRKGLFYEARYHGEPVCVFVGKDEAGKAKFACMRSITGNLRKDVYGSDKEYSFCYPPRNPGSRHVAVFEAPIDALSHATLQELKGWKWDGYNDGFRRNTKVESGNPDIVARAVENYGRNSLIKRLQANQCEWCGAENVPLEIHHVRKLKDLSGRKQWEIAMIGRKRKTMALCIDCHDKLHAGKLD